MERVTTKEAAKPSAAATAVTCRSTSYDKRGCKAA